MHPSQAAHKSVVLRAEIKDAEVVSGGKPPTGGWWLLLRGGRHEGFPGEFLPSSPSLLGTGAETLSTVLRGVTAFSKRESLAMRDKDAGRGVGS